MSSDLSVWWDALPTLEKSLWAISLFFSLLFVLQSVLTFFGGDSDVHDGDVHDGDGYQFFTIKNLVAFFTLFGWTGLAASQAGWGTTGSLIAAVIAGSAMVALMMFLMRKAAGMKHSGTLDLQNAIGLTGQAYLPIPAVRTGTGKVHLKVQGGVKELDAMTDDSATIPTGAIVQVTRIINDRILLVSTQ